MNNLYSLLLLTYLILNIRKTYSLQSTAEFWTYSFFLQPIIKRNKRIIMTYHASATSSLKRIERETQLFKNTYFQNLCMIFTFFLGDHLVLIHSCC